MKALKILAVVLSSTFAYSAANAQIHHRHRVVHYPHHHKM